MRWQPIRRATLHPRSSLGWACISSPPSRGELRWISILHLDVDRLHSRGKLAWWACFLLCPFALHLRSGVYIFNSHLLLNVFLNSFCCLSPANPPRVSPICKGVPSPETGPRKGPHWTSLWPRPHLFQFQELRANMRWRLGPGNLGPTFFANLAHWGIFSFWVSTMLT